MKIHFLDLENEYDLIYDPKKFFAYDRLAYDPVTSYLLYKLPSLKVTGVKTIKTEIYRPDLLSYNIYNRDYQYWWLLLEYNGILSFKELKAGKNINFFSLVDLNNLYFTLKTSETSLQILESQDIQIVSGIISEPVNNIGDKHRVYLVNNLDLITINHDLEKRPNVTFVTEDEDGNEKSEDILWRYTAGLETKQIIVTLGSLKTGKIILN